MIKDGHFYEGLMEKENLQYNEQPENYHTAHNDEVTREVDVSKREREAVKMAEHNKVIESTSEGKENKVKDGNDKKEKRPKRKIKAPNR